MPDPPAVQETASKPAAPPRSYKRLIQISANMLFWTAAVFVSAGRINWLRGWVCVATNVICMTAAGFVVRRRNPGLIETRSKWRHKGTKSFDKVMLAIYLPLTFFQPIVAGLDVVRFRWSAMPFWTLYLGILLYAVAIIPITWVMIVNPFAEPSVRIQTDRGHIVVSSGPYRFVRHPLYLGAIVMYPSTALVLGSMWALAVAALLGVLMVVRTALEDRTLRRELPGYEAFTAVTRYRLVPGLW